MYLEKFSKYYFTLGVKYLKYLSFENQLKLKVIRCAVIINKKTRRITKLSNSILLTISLIVKNEEKDLRRCLDSIKHLRETVSSELIITDTGSTDNTVDIAKEYTDKIYHYAWEGDFSKARNFGLDKAQGKWFMFLDADEWFIKTDEIEHFFKSNEKNKFKSCFYVQRNYSELDGSSYSDANILRIFKIEKGRRFQGSIHEHIMPVEPMKLLNDAVHHYGYAMKDPQVRKEKHERNLIPLLKEFEKNPNDLRLIQLLINQYNFIEDFETSIEYCKMGIEKEKKHPNFSYRVLFYRNLAEIYYVIEKDEELIELTNEYFHLRKKDKIMKTAADMTIYFLIGMVRMRQNLWTQAIDSFYSYLDLYELHVKGKLITIESITNSVSAGSPNNYAAILYNIAICNSKLGNYQEAVRVLSTIPEELRKEEHEKYEKTFLLGDDLKEKTEKMKANTEFEILGAKIKEQIKLLLEKEDYSNAATIIGKFETLCPLDPELPFLKEKAKMLN